MPACPCAWVLGDEIYGSNRRLRMTLEQREQPFVLAIRSNEKLWTMLDGRLGLRAASRLAVRLPIQARRRFSAGAGSKGERVYDWARLRLTRLQQPPWDHWLLIRRSRKDPKDLTYYVVFGPNPTTGIAASVKLVPELDCRYKPHAATRIPGAYSKGANPGSPCPRRR